MYNLVMSVYSIPLMIMRTYLAQKKFVRVATFSNKLQPCALIF